MIMPILATADDWLLKNNMSLASTRLRSDSLDTTLPLPYKKFANDFGEFLCFLDEEWPEYPNLPGSITDPLPSAFQELVDAHSVESSLPLASASASSTEGAPRAPGGVVAAPPAARIDF